MTSIRLKIAGDEYPLRTEEPELTERSAHEVSHFIQELRLKMPELNLHRIAVLAALHFAEQSLRLSATQHESDHFIREIDGMIDDTLRSISDRSESP